MRGTLQALCTALALCAMTAGAAAFDYDEEGELRAYLEHGMERHTALGYAAQDEVSDLAIDLRLDHPHLWSVPLREGVNYRIYGACDDDCADFDMEIYDDDGRLADRDIARDDTPYVQITPTRTGRHHVRVWLYVCRTETCAVMARVVEGGTPGARVSQPPPVVEAPTPPVKATPQQQ